MRRDAERLLERSREVRLGDAAHTRQSTDRPLLVRRGVHPVLRAEQATQQLGVLDCVASTHVASLTREHQPTSSPASHWLRHGGHGIFENAMGRIEVFKNFGGAWLHVI